MIRRAIETDLPTLIESDRHVRPDVLGRLVDNGRVLVAERAEVLVGWLRWTLLWDEVPFMNLLFVVEPARGHGVGSTLLAAWEESQAAEGYGSAMTSTQADEDAQHLYRKHGYVDCGVVLLPGQAAEVILRKEFGPG